MISVREAEALVLRQAVSFGRETTRLESSLGRMLAGPVTADRHYPPCDRSMMDGIAVSYASFVRGQRQFAVVATQQAGAAPVGTAGKNEAVKIMTGAVLPEPFDTVIPKEELRIEGSVATVTAAKVNQGQFIHAKGADASKGRVVVPAGNVITPTIIPVLASVGQAEVVVSKLPKVATITTGDELVDVDAGPTDYQLRRSNDYAMRAVLSRYACPADTFHVPDEEKVIRKLLQKCLVSYDCVLVSGGVSAGDFDYVQTALADLSVTKMFHGVAQKPGKPFWFGKHPDGAVVFAFPGNPVSMYVCLVRYFVPWLRACLGAPKTPDVYAVLDGGIPANAALTRFIHVRLRSDKSGKLRADPLAHNGSGDFISLIEADAFIEIPPGKTDNQAGSAYRIWPLGVQ